MKINKYVLTTLLLGLITSGSFAQKLDNLTKLGDGYFVKFSDRGDLIEIATNTNGQIKLNKEKTFDEVQSLKVSLEKSESSVIIVQGLNMCEGFVPYPQTSIQYNLQENADSVSLSGTALYGEIGLPAPAPDYLITNVRIKTRLRVYDIAGNQIDKNYGIGRNYVNYGDTNNSPNTIEQHWNGASSFANIVTSNPNYYEIRWVVRADFMVDAPEALQGGISDSDCYNVQSIKVSNKVIL